MTKRHYTETERIGIMLTALRDGVPETSVALQVPEATVYEWFQQSGGIRAVRSFVEEAEATALLTAKRAIYERVASVAPSLAESELMATFRAMLDKPAKESPAVSVTNVQATQERYEVDPKALAHAILTLKDAGAIES